MNRGNVTRAYLRVKEAQATFEACFKALYPPGASLEWERQGGAQAGTVVRYAYGDKLFVRNSHTGASYHIHMSSVLRAYR